jgi:hypothetical protein
VAGIPEHIAKFWDQRMRAAIFAHLDAGGAVSIRRCARRSTGFAAELDLPRPPSVNRMMRKLGNKTPCVRVWTGKADYHCGSRSCPAEHGSHY